jgi:hypothetical protein
MRHRMGPKVIPWCVHLALGFIPESYIRKRCAHQGMLLLDPSITHSSPQTSDICRMLVSPTKIARFSLAVFRCMRHTGTCIARLRGLTQICRRSPRLMDSLRLTLVGAGFMNSYGKIRHQTMDSVSASNNGELQCSSMCTWTWIIYHAKRRLNVELAIRSCHVLSHFQKDQSDLLRDSVYVSFAFHVFSLASLVIAVALYAAFR